MKGRRRRHPLEYPVRLIPDDNDTLRVKFPDFPEAHTWGETKRDALRHAADCLASVLWMYRKDGTPIPWPSRVRPGQPTVRFPRTL